MNKNAFTRTELLLGSAALKRLESARVAVFGVGGVGGYVVEGLVRSGIGALDLIDHDSFSESNLNRQILATTETIGRLKVDVAAERVRQINPDCTVRAIDCFYLPETRDRFDFREYDYVVDAIDTVTGKLSLIQAVQEAGTPIISSMGAGNKLDPTAFRVADIYETSVCPLARVMRQECRKRGIEKLKVVYSTEIPLVPGASGHGAAESKADQQEGTDRREGAADNSLEAPPPGRRSVPGSVAFVPSVAGLIIAGEVVKDLIRQ